MNDIVRKVLAFEIKEVSPRTLEFVGSTEDKDRLGDIIDSEGWNLKDYKKNPIFMWAHNYTNPPIGKATKVWIDDKKLKFNIQFADKETYDFADTIYRLYKGGFLRATSVGFSPIEFEYIETKDKDSESIFMGKPRHFIKQNLLELSGCPVPTNPNALAEATTKGIISAEEMKSLESSVTKPEETENYYRVPVAAEEGKHGDHRIRTIDISKEKGIKALYCGECKVVITYLFDKEKWGSMKECGEWVKEHEKSAKEISQAEIKDELDYCLSIIKAGNLNEENKALIKLIETEIKGITGSHIPDNNISKEQIAEMIKTTVQSKLQTINRDNLRQLVRQSIISKLN